MKKTIGGDRLGSGKKMKVDLHGYERSTHDLGYIWRSTAASGTLIPFLNEVALPGDTFDINLDCITKTVPTRGPLFGSYKIQLDVFQIPIRLYNSLLHNNALNIGLNMSQIKLPVLGLTANTFDPDEVDPNTAQINPSCLLNYLGIRGIGNPGNEQQTRYFNAIPLLAYWDIYKNYYANKQEEIGSVIHTPSEAIIETVDVIHTVTGGTTNDIPQVPGASYVYLTGGTVIVAGYTGTTPIPSQIMVNTLEWGKLSLQQLCGTMYDDGTQLTGSFNVTRWGNTTAHNWDYKTSTDINTGKPKIATFPLANIDTMRENILAYNSKLAAYSINSANLEPYIWIGQGIDGQANALSSQEGLALKTFQSDLFNNWIQTEWIDGVDGINKITAVDTTAGEFTIDQLNLAKKVYDMLNRIAISGGTYDDWLDAVYTHDRYKRAETPMYMGGLSKELIFSEVVSNSETTDQPLGSLAGRGNMGKKHKGGKVVVKVDEPSYIMGIFSLTPRIDYSQGNKWDVNLQTMDDLHKPALDQIGFQDLITEQMAYWDTTWDSLTNKWVQKSAGKQPAWLNYMTNVNTTHGDFALINNSMFMTLNRRYEPNILDGTVIGIKDLTTYIDPSKFNFIFAETALDAQNFWVQIAVDITARRKLSAKIMPNL